jgi:hypothetical protein
MSITAILAAFVFGCLVVFGLLAADCVTENDEGKVIEI